MDELIEKFVKPHVLPLTIGMAGLIFFVYGLMGLGEKKADKPDILFEAASDVAATVSPTPIPKPKEILVDIEGAIMKPGVYRLKEDSRVQDVLIAAGGMSEQANREQVAKRVNLASKVVDGAKIYIPLLGDEDVMESVDDFEETDGGIININSATQEELESLVGIGEVTAEKIISERPYGDINELLDKKIVGKSVFEKIKDTIGI